MAYNRRSAKRMVSKLTLQGRDTNVRCTTVENYKNIFDNSQELDNGAEPGGGSSEMYQLITFEGKGVNSLESCKSVLVKNEGPAAAEIAWKTQLWDASANAEATATIASTGTGTETIYWTTNHMILSPGEFMFFPNNRIVSYTRDNSADPGVVTSAGNHSNLASNTAMADLTSYSAAGKIDSGVNTDEALDDSETGVDVNGGDAYKFMVGDYIRVENEIMKVTAIASVNEITVERGALGSTAATHTNPQDIFFHIFNHNVQYDADSVTKTDGSGNFICSSFFGQGRSIDQYGHDGIVPGTVSVKFYTEGGYQELGLTGQNVSTSTGLTASTAYEFKITQDALAQQTITFTTDASNVNWGGTNGVLQKIQTAMNENTVLDNVTVSIVAGDIRFTSGTNLSTSTIALAAGTDGSVAEFLGTGIVPASGETAIVGFLPDDTSTDIRNNTIKNSSNFLMDKGDGTLSRTKGGFGSINYETGRITMSACPRNAEFVVTASSGALAGGDEKVYDSGSAEKGNILTTIYGRSLSKHSDTSIRTVVTY